LVAPAVGWADHPHQSGRHTSTHLGSRRVVVAPVLRLGSPGSRVTIVTPPLVSVGTPSLTLSVGGRSRFDAVRRAPAYGSHYDYGHLSHHPLGYPSGLAHGHVGDPHFGTFIDYPVSLYPRLRVTDARKIAPHALPTVIAIRHPDACAHACSCCPTHCAYAPVYVPDYPYERLRVPHHGAKIHPDYGCYDVHLVSH